MLKLCQGSDSAADFAIHFCILAAESGWNDVALTNVFRNGLIPKLQTELACRDVDLGLDDLISPLIRLNQLIRGKTRRTSFSPRRLVTPRTCQNMRPLRVKSGSKAAGYVQTHDARAETQMHGWTVSKFR